MIVRRVDAALLQAHNDAWPDDRACGRCGGTGLIQWAGVYAPRDGGREKGPCIRCRPNDFCETIGLWQRPSQARRA